MGYFSMLACMLVLLVMNDISKIKKKLNKIDDNINFFILVLDLICNMVCRDFGESSNNK